VGEEELAMKADAGERRRARMARRFAEVCGVRFEGEMTDFAIRAWSRTLGAWQAEAQETGCEDEVRAILLSEAR
jgi:hypothetical protein